MPPRKRPLSSLAPGVVAGALVPFVVLAELAWRGQLGANPISTILNQFGFVAMLLLVSSLACTPLKTVTGWKWPLRVRKSLGVMGFVYAALHFLTYIGVDQMFNLKTVWEDVYKRPFILIGFTALLLLIPLAVTSTSGAIRRLGKRWLRLHRLVYVISPLVIIHFIMRMKADIRQPLAYGFVLLVCLVLRVVTYVRRRRRAPAWSGFRQFRVAQRNDDVGHVSSFYLEPLDGKRLPDYQPGQYLTFQLNVDRPSSSVIRCYSLSDRPDPQHYRISVKRVPPGEPNLPPGVASNFLHDRVKENDVLEVKAPGGRFIMKSPPRRIAVMIAGGIGITPLLAMLNEEVQSGRGREIHFFLGVRNSADHCFREHLRRIASENPRIKVRVAYSAPLPTDRAGHDYDHAGRISVELLKNSLPSLDCDFYVCGPSSMMAGLKSDLAVAGVPPANFHMEAFGAASVRKAAVPGMTDGKARITFERSGKTVEWDPAYGNLLECAEVNGVAIDFGCRAGNCGTCAVEIVAGDVDYTIEAGATPDEGACLTCVTVPRSDLSLQV